MPLMVIMLKTTVFQSMAISRVGMPSMAILPPWHMLASMSRKASGLPDISRPTSKPSFMPSSFWALGDRPLADVDGQGRAHLRGQLEAIGFTSVTTTCRAPAWRTTAAAMMPIGPAPVISTSSPSTSN